MRNDLICIAEGHLDMRKRLFVMGAMLVLLVSFASMPAVFASPRSTQAQTTSIQVQTVFASPVTVASIASTSAKVTPSRTMPCSGVTFVVLHGSQPPTVSCISSTTSRGTKPGITPDGLGTSPCNDTALWLYANANFQDPELCLIGAGQANLSDFSINWLQTWADVVSSYWAGCSAGQLSNAYGDEWIDFDPYERNNYVGDWFNDKAQYVTLYSNCS